MLGRRQKRPRTTRSAADVDFDGSALVPPEFDSGLPAALCRMFDHLPGVFLFVKDDRHRFCLVNRAVWLMHGCRDASEMLGRTDFDFHPPALAAEYVEKDRRVMQANQPLVADVGLVRGADGHIRWYCGTKLPIRNSAGKVIGIVGVMQPYAHGGEATGDYGRLMRAFEHVLENYDQPQSVSDLAERAGMSRRHFQRTFRQLFGTTPKDYVHEIRLQAARHALEATSESIGAIAAKCGFYDQSHFVKRFKAATGVRPLEYRRQFSR